MLFLWSCLYQGGEMQKEGPGEMASSLKSWVHAPHLHWFLWPFLCLVSRGSWCRWSVLLPTGRVSGKVSAGGLPWPLWPRLAQALPACSRTASTRVSSLAPFLGGPGWAGMWQSNKPRALEQNRDTHLHWWKFKFPKLFWDKKRRFSLSTDFPSYKRPVYFDQLS